MRGFWGESAGTGLEPLPATRMTWEQIAEVYLSAIDPFIGQHAVRPEVPDGASRRSANGHLIRNDPARPEYPNRGWDSAPTSLHSLSQIAQGGLQWAAMNRGLGGLSWFHLSAQQRFWRMIQLGGVDQRQQPAPALVRQAIRDFKCLQADARTAQQGEGTAYPISPVRIPIGEAGEQVADLLDLPGHFVIEGDGSYNRADILGWRILLRMTEDYPMDDMVRFIRGFIARYKRTPHWFIEGAEWHGLTAVHFDSDWDRGAPWDPADPSIPDAVGDCPPLRSHTNGRLIYHMVRCGWHQEIDRWFRTTAITWIDPVAWDHPGDWVADEVPQGDLTPTASNFGDPIQPPPSYAQAVTEDTAAGQASDLPEGDNDAEMASEEAGSSSGPSITSGAP